MRSFFVGKIVELKVVGEEGYWRGRVLRTLADLDVMYILFLPENTLEGRYITTTSIIDIRVVGIIPEPEIRIPKAPRRKRVAKKKPRRAAK